jgi:uncharacterized protein YhaN
MSSLISPFFHRLFRPLQEDEEKAEQLAAVLRRVENLEQELHVLLAQCEKHERKIAALEVQTAAALVPQVDSNKAEVVAVSPLLSFERPPLCS